MKLLSRSEEVILLAIWRLRDNAYGVTIRNAASESTGYTWDFAAVYIALDKLTKKEYVAKSMSEPVSERGGRSKCMYTLTAEGKDALRSIQKVQRMLWQGISDGAFDPEEQENV